METWSRPAGEPNFPAAAVDGRRPTLSGAIAGTTSSCGIPARHALQKIGRGPSVGTASLQLLGDARDQLHSDDDDLDLGTGTLDDALSLAELQSVYHLPSKEAARSLNVSLSRLKRSCRAHNVLRWPHRKLSSLSNLQDTIGNDKNMKLADKQRILQQIVNEIAAVRANPDHTIDPRLDEIRQAKYKLKYYHKTKHIHASVSAAARKRRQSSGCSERSRSVSHSGAPTSGTAVSGGVPPQQMSVSLPNLEPPVPAAAMVGRNVPFTSTVSGPPAFSASVYTTTNAFESDARAFTAGHMGGSIDGRLAFSSPPENGGGPVRLSANRGSISGGGFSMGGGGGGSMKDGHTLKDSGGGASTYSSSSEFISRAASLTAPAATWPPRQLPAGRLSEPNCGLGCTPGPSWCVLSMQPGPAPSLGSVEVVFNQQQQQQQQQHLPHMQHSQQQHHRSLHHQLLHWEQQVQIAAVRRPSFGITDETGGAAHLLPGIAPWARQSVTSLEGGSASMAADGCGIGVIDGSARLHHSVSHNSLWMLPPPQQPGVAPHCVQGTSSPGLIKAPSSSPPASRGVGVGGGGDGGGAVPAVLQGPNSAGSVSNGFGDAFPIGPVAPHHTTTDVKLPLPPPSAAASGLAASPAAVGMTESTRGSGGGGGGVAKPSVPYSHGVVNTSCPPPRCSSTGDPQAVAPNSAAMQLSRQTSASPPVYGAFIGGSGGARGGSGGASSCPGGGSKVYSTNTEFLGGLPEGVNRGRFLSADGAQYQQPPGLTVQERQASDTAAFHAAATAASRAASATRAEVGGNASGSTTGPTLRFEARMGMSSGHGTVGPSWFALEARVAAAPVQIVVPVSEPAGVHATAPSSRATVSLLSREGEMRREQQQQQLQQQQQQQRQPNERDVLQMYSHKQTHGHKHYYYDHHQQQHLMEHARMQGPFNNVQPLPRMPIHMAPSLEHQMGGQYLQPYPTQCMHQEQQQQHQQQLSNCPYYGSFSGGGRRATAMESSSSPTPGMQEIAFASAPYAKYGDDGRAASTAAAQRSSFGEVRITQCAGSQTNVAPTTEASQSLRASGPPALGTSAYLTAATAGMGMATVRAPGTSVNCEGHLSSSSPVAMAASGGGGREDSSAGVGGGCSSGIDGGGGGAGGGEFLSSAGGSDGVGAAPLISPPSFVLPGVTNTPPGRAVTTGVPSRMPSPSTGPWGPGQYSFRGFADGVGNVGPEWMRRVEVGGGNNADIAGSAWLGARPGGPREALEGRFSVVHKQPLQQQHPQQQQNVQQQVPPLRSAGNFEPWSSFSAFSSFPFDGSSPVIASSGAVAAAAFPAGRTVTAIGGAADVGTTNAVGSSDADMDSAQAAIGEAGSGNGPGGAILANLDWFLD